MKQDLAKVILKSGKDNSVKRWHPWVFSGAIKKIRNQDGKEVSAQDGDLLYVTSNRDEFLGIGHYQEGSIAVRIISFVDVAIDEDFWLEKLNTAYQLREKIHLANNSETNIYRLVHAEGDNLPGLIIDFYNGTAVIQSHSIGMHYSKDAIVKALKSIYKEDLNAIFDKSADTLPKFFKETVTNQYLYQNKEVDLHALEHACKYKIDWLEGQKTGFFIDQRENRALLGAYAKNKKVLNTFCYTGGFSVVALKNGADLVHSVDSSKRAIELTDENVALNQLEEKHQSFAVDTFKFFETSDTSLYDIIVLDPPAFAKHQNVKHNAVQGYKRLNATAIQKIKAGGIIFTFSCSQVVDDKLFYNTIMSAAIQVGRTVRVLKRLSQPEDHPTNIFHPEGHYLKGLVIQVL